jgi:hypothetical protein
MPPTPLELPPRIGWSRWLANWQRTGKPDPRKGSHVLFDGPTQSGKTVLARMLARERNFVVVFGTKATDDSLDAYEAEGYTRVEHWPPTNKEWKDGGWSAKEARFILWPQIKKREDLRKPATRQQFAKCLDDAFINGGWTVVIDEGLWCASRSGLNLGSQLSDFAYGASSAGASMYLLLQRPSGVPRVTWSSVMDSMLFHSGVTADLRELASLGTYDPKAVVSVVKDLAPPGSAKDYSFLHLPCRGGAQWSVSEVDL